MIKSNKISTKIKLIGALLIFLMASVIATTIYLNQQNIKDSLLINIAGKQRMLTQKIAKNIFYTHYNSLRDFNELWRSFYKDVEEFKKLANLSSQRTDELEKIVASIYKNNATLLNNVDKLVTMYTNHSEDKTNFIKSFQYLSGAILFILFIYSLLQLKSIESHVDSFMQYSKMLINNEDISSLTPLKLEAESESEIVEVSDTINCFIKKINSAVEYSNEALLQSQKASSKLEELTDEFDTILDELKDTSLISKHLNNSEDMVIESTEELINSTKKLTNLKNELDKLIKSCQELK